MIRLHDVDLPDNVNRQLRVWQRDVSAVKNYERRIEKAQTDWKKKNKKNNPTFAVVRAKLAEMCAGPQRCGYCEDSAADEVDHIRPKSFYPDIVFDWENFLYSCGICNKRKLAKTAVVDRSKREIERLERTTGEPPARPPKGPSAFINPRQEDPTRFLYLDLSATFAIVPREGLSRLDRQRAEYTLELLGFEKRAYLRDARQSAYEAFEALLKNYIAAKEKRKNVDRADEVKNKIRKRPHPYVWFEMKRQHDKIPALAKLFGDAPEALAW
jgi:uncharacterized protein (TIGR02646 family)